MYCTWPIPSIQIVAAVFKSSNTQTIPNAYRCPPWFVFNNTQWERGVLTVCIGGFRPAWAYPGNARVKIRLILVITYKL